MPLASNESVISQPHSQSEKDAAKLLELPNGNLLTMDSSGKIICG